MNDRITKLLLTLIAVALWALLLRPTLTAVPAHAQEARLNISSLPRFNNPLMLQDGTRALYIVDNAGWVYLLNPITLEIKRSVRLQSKP